MKRVGLYILAALLILAALPTALFASEGRKLFLESAIEDTTRNTATLPIFQGMSGGQPVWYVVTESSDKKDARTRKVNYAPKLANARGTAAVQKVTMVDGVIHFPATVDFSPNRVVVPGPTGFPPAQAQPGAIGQPGYSPLIELPNGVILNASQIANASGLHDKLVAPPDIHARQATFQESEGFYDDKEFYYVSFDSSAPDVAALEGVTFAPSLNAAPGQGSNDKKSSARSGIIPFVNGQIGAANPNRQGLNSALLDGLDPLNVLESSPKNSKYSPLWDVYATMWTQTAIDSGQNTRQTEFDTIRDLADEGLVTGPGGGAWGAIGVIVNCPVISEEK
jgi:hypothetical protein